MGRDQRRLGLTITAYAALEEVATEVYERHGGNTKAAGGELGREMAAALQNGEAWAHEVGIWACGRSGWKVMDHFEGQWASREDDPAPEPEPTPAPEPAGGFTPGSPAGAEPATEAEPGTVLTLVDPEEPVGTVTVPGPRSGTVQGVLFPLDERLANVHALGADRLKAIQAERERLRKQREAQRAADRGLVAEEKTIKAALKALPMIKEMWKTHSQASDFDMLLALAGLDIETLGLTESAADWLRVRVAA